MYPRSRFHEVPAANVHHPFAGADADRRAALFGRHSALVPNGTTINGNANGVVAVNGVRAEDESSKDRERIMLSTLPSNDQPSFYSPPSTPSSPGPQASTSTLSNNRGSKLLLAQTGDHARAGRLGGWVSGEVLGRDAHLMYAPPLAGKKGKRIRQGPMGVQMMGKRRKLSPSGGSDNTGRAAESEEDSEEDSDDDPSLRPAIPQLPPTPLTPADLLHSSTLSHLFSRHNRTFHQIAQSATGLIEADLKTGCLVREAAELLRGDFASGKWRRVAMAEMERKRVEEEERVAAAAAIAAAGATEENGSEEGEQKLPSPPVEIQIHHAEATSDVLMNGEDAPTAPPSVAAAAAGEDEEMIVAKVEADDGNEGLGESTALLASGAAVEETAGDGGESSGSSSRGAVGGAGSDTAPGVSTRRSRRSNAATTASQGGEDAAPTSYRQPPLNGAQRTAGASLDARVRVFTDALPWITSLFVEEEDITVSVPNVTPEGHYLHPSHPQSTIEETWTPEQQSQVFSHSAYELQRFLADLTDYKDRLTELRDGCLGVDKRRKAMWGLVKVAAGGYEETATGKPRKDDSAEVAALAAAQSQALAIANGGREEGGRGRGRGRGVAKEAAIAAAAAAAAE